MAINIAALFMRMKIQFELF